MSVTAVICSYIALYLFYRVYKFYTAYMTMKHVPGMRILFSPMSPMGAILGTTWWNPGLEWNWKRRATGYSHRRYDIISCVSLFGGKPMYFTAAPEVIKQLLLNEHKARLIKHEELMFPFLQWGGNLISANGEDWRRHRRVMAAAFTTQTYNLVAQETASAYSEMMKAEGWTQAEVFVSNCNRIPSKLALLIISRCGFGLPLSWAGEDECDATNLSLGACIAIVTREFLYRLILPEWAFRFPIKKLRFLRAAWMTLADSMHELVQERRRFVNGHGSEHVYRGDVFTRAVEALDPDAKVGLEESEAIGNIYSLMFAGSETTAHAMSATVVMFAIHQEEQSKAYLEVVQAFPADTEIMHEKLTNLPYLTMCFWEALRMFPAGSTLPRDFTEDVSVRVTHPREETFVFPKGSRLMIDMIAAGHDPHAFPDPDRFLPERWLGVSEPQVLMFGQGPRACVGRKFAHVEVLTFLSLLLRDWYLDVVIGEGETRADVHQRVLDSAGRIGLSFGIGPVDLKLRRRSL